MAKSSCQTSAKKKKKCKQGGGECLGGQTIHRQLALASINKIISSNLLWLLIKGIKNIEHTKLIKYTYDS